MTPGLLGRIETRWFLLAVVGSAVTVALVPFLSGGTVGERYRATFMVLLIVAVVGVVWELIYHGIQQFRWEKDWPTGFGLLVGVPEGIVAWFIASNAGLPGTAGIGLSTFIVHFSLVWVAVWLVASGPMRLASVHWRYDGGRLL
jgi:hypothetical protein